MTEPQRPDPDILLAALEKESAHPKRGQLKVFLGMCAGVGKTYAMLETARRDQATGRDVVIGYVETHGRVETDAMAAGLPTVPRRPLEYRGIICEEMDLDAVLARKPRLVLVDELAHTNAPGSRHPKRYQDVNELLDAGIDVYTTLNVQHLDSLADTVRQITRVTVHETVPDTALADAELELVDLPPDELRARLAAGKVYLPERADLAQHQFFREGNLVALRELTLRFAAEHVGQDVLAFRQAHHIGEPWKIGQRLLVGVSPSPTSGSLVRWACRLAGELKASWLAVSVELPHPLDDAERASLSRHLALARELGAEVITTSDEDVVHGLLRVAHEHNVTQIVVGKPMGWRTLDLLRGGSLLNRLIRESGNIDVHAVRAESSSEPTSPRRLSYRLDSAQLRGYGVALSVVALVTGLNAVLQHWLGYQSLALVYLLSVVILAMFVARGPTLAAATLTALLWNYLFVPPLFTLQISGATDVMLFFTYFTVALAMGHLTARLRAQQTAERQREQRATALYLLSRELTQATDAADLLAIILREVSKNFSGEAAVSVPNEDANGPLIPYFASTWALTAKEHSVAEWAFRHRQTAGHGTDTLPSADGLHLPLQAGNHALGVLSIRFKDSSPLAPAQRDLLDAYVRQIALALDRERLRDSEQQAKLAFESERLNQALLNSISHELKTPIAAITSATTSLSERFSHQPESFEKLMVEEIFEATRRLHRFVGNLLDMTRLESGRVKTKCDWCDINDLLGLAVRETAKELKDHPLTIEIAPGLPLVHFDFVLMQQALNNLLLNVAAHTPPSTPVLIQASIENRSLVLAVADRGPGLPPEAGARVFEKFYRGQAAPAGGTGLGLSIVKGFVEAHGGQVQAENRPGGGACFTIRLPLTQPPVLSSEATP
jgi:two-component system, OmpR family, sensor histidine kinase KdpD